MITRLIYLVGGLPALAWLSAYHARRKRELSDMICDLAVAELHNTHSLRNRT